MPQSVTSILDVSSSDGFVKAVNRADNLGSLLDLCPASYRPRMQDIVNTVYRASIKSNHTRSYLATLEKHKSDGTLPSEIGGRVHSPALQISKEFQATASYRDSKNAIDNKVAALGKTLLVDAISLKTFELQHLQGLFVESAYKEAALSVASEVAAQLASDAGVSLNPDGSVPVKSLPAWIREDAELMGRHSAAFPARAVALGYAIVSKEVSRKMRTLTVKQSTDDDIEMQDDASRNESVASIAARTVRQLMKEYKIQHNGMPSSCSAGPAITDTPCRKEQEGSLQPSQTQSSTEYDWQGHETRSQRKQKRKREWEQGVDQEVRVLHRAWLSGLPSGQSGLLSTVGTRSIVAENTMEASLFLDKHSELFCASSSFARAQFVMNLSPSSLLESSHRREEGVFLGPGVVMSPIVEYQLALNLKFIFHHIPNPLKVLQSWSHLERSVRIRWHFRNQSRAQPKFYIPRPTWMPPADEWNPVIEAGLRRGKDLLFERTAALPPSSDHRPNPDLRRLRSFIESNDILMKITDKNLGVAAMNRTWYIHQCERLLEDASTYDLVDQAYVEWIRQEAFNRIVSIVNQSQFGKQPSEFLLSSDEEKAIPEFHGIPKVHKSPWKIRPIIPNHSWVTRKASEVSDYVLRTFHKKWFPWVVDSTRDVIKLVEATTISKTEDVWIVTGDVESFYTNVDVDGTLSVLREGLESLELEGEVDPQATRDLIEVVMATNCFSFNGKFFHQRQGIAMGTACAPAFANCNLGVSEILVEDIVNCRSHTSGLVLYARYIDDIFLVFKGKKAACESFLENLSSSLKPFTISWEICSTSQRTSFLDIEFFFEGRFGDLGLQTKVFRKKLNKHQYIPWSSAHPLTVKRAFVKAELTRFMVISSKQVLFEERRQEFIEALHRRGYPTGILRDWIKQVAYRDRAWTLSKSKSSSRGLPLMLPSEYDEVWEYVDLKEVFGVMMDSWGHLGVPLPESLMGPLIKSLRRTDNLFDKLSSWNKAVLKGRLLTG